MSRKPQPAPFLNIDLRDEAGHQATDILSSPSTEIQHNIAAKVPHRGLPKKRGLDENDLPPTWERVRKRFRRNFVNAGSATNEQKLSLPGQTAATRVEFQRRKDMFAYIRKRFASTLKCNTSCGVYTYSIVSVNGTSNYSLIRQFESSFAQATGIKLQNRIPLGDLYDSANSRTATVRMRYDATCQCLAPPKEVVLGAKRASSNLSDFVVSRKTAVSACNTHTLIFEVEDDLTHPLGLQGQKVSVYIDAKIL